MAPPPLVVTPLASATVAVLPVNSQSSKWKTELEPGTIYKAPP